MMRAQFLPGFIAMGHDLKLKREDDIPAPPKPEPLTRAGVMVKAQAKTPSELAKQISRDKGWL